MSEVKNCLTCKWEPEWYKNSGGVFGQCKCDVMPVVVTHRYNALIRKGKDSKTCYVRVRAFTNCPAHQPKDNSHAM